MKTPIQFLCKKCKEKMREFYRLTKREYRKKLKIKVASQQEAGKVKITKTKK